MGFSQVDKDLITVFDTINRLSFNSICVSFSDIRRESGLHPQTLTNLLKRGRTLGLIADCSELGLGSGYTVLQKFIISLEQSVVNEVVEVNKDFIVMKHTVRNKMYNNAGLPIYGAFIKVFGDVVLDKPLIYKGSKVYEVKFHESVDKYYFFHFDEDVEVKPGETYTYEYEFYLKYFPPVDYFIYESFNPGMLLTIKTYLTKSGKSVIKDVKVEHPPTVKIFNENRGKTYHEVEVKKITAYSSIKLLFYLA